MKATERLETDRLLLRKPVTDDTEALHAYASDPEVKLHLPRQASNDINETISFIEWCIQAWKSGEAFPWVIEVKESGEVVGMVEARASKNGVELGYVLNRSAWGNGYMTEAVACVAGWALSQSDVFRVWAYVNVANIASQRVLEKVGMVREGVLHRWAPHPNISETPSDAYMYAIWRRDEHPTISALHHVQLAMPVGGEEEAEDFYEKILGIPRAKKPAHLEARGGAWFENEHVRIHLGVEDDFKPAKKAHPALMVDDLEALQSVFEKEGVEVVVDQPLPGFDRFYVSDPFGNRLEFLQPSR